MSEEVKNCVNARINFFDQYYVIPEEMKSEVASFIDDINELGNNCSDAKLFEEKFVSTGLSERFTSILPKCTPKKFKMTKEQKNYSKTVYKEIINDNKKEIIKDAIKSATDRVYNDVKGEAIAKNRERMIEDGTFDEYTRTNNKIHDAGRLFGWIANKFGKK